MLFLDPIFNDVNYKNIMKTFTDVEVTREKGKLQIPLQ